MAALNSKAAVSLINNKGDIGKTLKELGRSDTVKTLVSAAVTAGIAEKLGAAADWNGYNQSWQNRLTTNLATAGSTALANTAIHGGSLSDGLEKAVLNALVQSGHTEASLKIKGIDNSYIAHKIAHAAAGCAAGAANKGSCADGAIGAAVGEIVGEAMLNGRDAGSLSGAERQKILGTSKVIAGSVAALSGGDVDTAANAAQVAVVNNALAARRAATRWTARQQAEHEYARLQIQALTNQIRSLDPQFNGIAMARNPNEPRTNRDVQIYRSYYDNLRANMGLPAQPIYKAKMANGSEFNRIMASKYPYNELYVVNRSSPSGYVRLDSYNPIAGEIVSRKFTQLSQIQASTAIGYIREAANKYQPGSVIANVPSTPSTLRGDRLKGDVILEVPVQTRPIPASVLKAATQHDVIIRDHTGKVYR